MLLASLTFAVAAIRLGRIGALAQQLNAIESLASVDTVCVDKTGTLTENRLGVAGVVPAMVDVIPAHWNVYFNVTDVDEAVARVLELGGRVISDPDDVVGVGRMATVADPQGGMFALMTGHDG